jgi:hypothetical protein
MSLFRRAPEARVAAAPAVEAEPSSNSSGTFRIAIAHTDPDHPSAAAAHWGPAYNAAYAEMAAHILGVPADSVDLLGEALRAAAKVRDDYRGADGWEVWIERLSDDGQWERVG